MGCCVWVCVCDGCVAYPWWGICGGGVLSVCVGLWYVCGVSGVAWVLCVCVCGGVLCVGLWRVCGISMVGYLWWGVLCVCVGGWHLRPSHSAQRRVRPGRRADRPGPRTRLTAELLFSRPCACHRGLFLVQGRSYCSVHSECFTLCPEA